MRQNYETIFQAAQYYPSLMAVLAYGQRFLPSMVFPIVFTRPRHHSYPFQVSLRRQLREGFLGETIHLVDARIECGSILEETYSWCPSHPFTSSCLCYSAQCIIYSSAKSQFAFGKEPFIFNIPQYLSLIPTLPRCCDSGMGGGVLSVLGSHIIDLLTYLDLGRCTWNLD